IDYTPGEAAGWWEFFKTASFWKGGNWLTPVLVLDQFEEMFTLQSAEGRRAIAEEIGQLAGGGMPGRVKQRRRDGEELPFSESPPEVKVVLSLREEYVGALQELFPEVPNILGERVRLAPMSREQAELAIVEPAVLSEPGFKTQPFRYAPDALDKLFEFLCGEKGDIEPFQLQVLCRHIEGQVSKRAREGEDLTVDGSYLGSRKEMEGILLGFYLSAIKKLSATKARRAARQLCENDLLSKDGH
ncbi:MAG: hypothetical protein GY731_19710, partial [Gammaproteobacteria bacterium]|nr:hypothetical protein [Gammaproteobacteria bacterium]